MQGCVTHAHERSAATGRARGRKICAELDPGDVRRAAPSSQPATAHARDDPRSCALCARFSALPERFRDAFVTPASFVRSFTTPPLRIGPRMRV